MIENMASKILSLSRKSPARYPTARKRRRPLSRDTILRAALKLIEDEGFDNFSMRHLGRALNIEAMSIYHHFASKDDLLNGLLGLLGQERIKLLESITENSNSDDSWKKKIRLYLSAFRTVGRAYPEAFRLLAQRPVTTPESGKAGKMYMDAIVETGLRGHDAVIAYRTILCFASGFVLLENAKTKPFYTTGSFDLEYEKGTELILTGIEQCLQNRASPSRPKKPITSRKAGG